MSQPNIRLPVIIVFGLLLAGCQLSPEGVADKSTLISTPTLTPEAHTPTPTKTSTPSPIPPSISKLIVNGTELTLDGLVYQIPGELNPGEVLDLIVTIRDDGNGKVEVIGTTKNYIPSPDNQSEVQLRLVVIPDVSSNMFPLLLSSGDDTIEYSLTFTPGSEWPPLVIVDAPSEMVIGERVVLDASDSFDFDGDPITFSWSQVHNPDKYTGGEYVTGNQVELEPTNDAVTAFTPEWPGVYRFQVEASNDDGENTQIVDVTVYPTHDLFAIRGVAIDGKTDNWTDDDVRQLLVWLKSLGLNYIQLGIHDTMQSPTSNEILIDRCREDWIMTLDESVRLIDLAHAEGLGVMLNPHLACTIDGNWYEYWNISPEDPAAWFESFKEYMLYYAKLADEHDVEILDIGMLMGQFYGFSQGWEELLDSVRDEYSGRVTFSIDEYSYFPQTQRLDMFLSFFNLNGSGVTNTYTKTGNNHPTVSEMTYWFELELSRYMDRLQAKYEKPIVATDIYLWSVDGMNIDPVSIYWKDHRTVDNQELVDYTEAALRVMAERNWEGFFFWSLKIGETSTKEPGIHDRPIEQMLRVWFSPLAH